jgi:hypothetical protein
MKNSKFNFRNAPAIVGYTILAVVFNPIRRAFAIILFLTAVVLAGVTVFPFLFLFFGIDTANNFMDKYILPIVGWWD